MGVTQRSPGTAGWTRGMDSADDSDRDDWTGTVEDPPWRSRLDSGRPGSAAETVSPPPGGGRLIFGSSTASVAPSWRVGSGSDLRPSGPRAGSSPFSPGSALESRPRLDFLPVVDEFTAAWERGEAPVAEDYLRRLDPDDDEGAVELIYREFCLSEADGLNPDPSSFMARFPRHGRALERLLRLHGECPPSLLDRWVEPDAPYDAFPEAGDSIGPYLLRRELGRGGFARVFLAEQADLANRPVVVKVSTRPTREPWLLARARHSHIVEIVSHAVVNDGAFQLICMPFWGGRRWGRSWPLAGIGAAPRPPGPTSSPISMPSPRRSIRRSTRRDRPARSWPACRTPSPWPGSSPGWPRRSTMPSAGTWPTGMSSRRTSC